MWQIQTQVDSWLNIGGNSLPDCWIRISEVQRVQGVEDRKYAQVVLKDGTLLASSYAVDKLMEIIAKANGLDEVKK